MEGLSRRTFYRLLATIIVEHGIAIHIGRHALLLNCIENHIRFIAQPEHREGLLHDVFWRGSGSNHHNMKVGQTRQYFRRCTWQHWRGIDNYIVKVHLDLG